MIGQPAKARDLLRLFRDPVSAEKRALLAQRWQGLDPALRLPAQGLGQKATGCGATIGIPPRCDFACTGCYLGHEANHIPALPTAAILAQLDELRRYLGPKSNVQITDGEVTLRPLPELLEILRHARAIGVVPMVMTHGDSFRRRPGLLERLMEEGLLTEVSIHIDITQPVAGVTYVYPCRFGTVTAATADGAALPVTGADLYLPAGTAHAEISYA